MPGSGPSACAEKDWQQLLASLAQLPPLALAFSGGLDSRFLAHAAQKAGCDVLLLHAEGPHIPARESRYALDWAQRTGLALRSLPMQALEIEGVRDNSRQRCYHCKKHLLSTLKALATREQRLLCDGTNADDLRVYRPGLRALEEEGVLSPLARAGLRKQRLRALGALTGLEAPEQSARPCLLTRLAYGLKPDATMLAQIEAAECALEEKGLKDFRLRLTPAPVLQTLPLSSEGPSKVQVAHILTHYGFAGAEIREESSISGFFDREEKL